MKTLEENNYHYLLHQLKKELKVEFFF